VAVRPERLAGTALVEPRLGRLPWRVL